MTFTKFGPQVDLTELKPKDFALLIGRIVWLSVTEKDGDTGETKVLADVVGRVAVVTRVQDAWNEDSYKYGIGFVEAHNDPFNVTLPNDNENVVLVSADISS